MKGIYKKNKFEWLIQIFEEREKILMLLVLIISIIFTVKLIELQIINGKEYRELSSNKMLRTVAVEAPRGEIYDRNGVILASNKLGFDVELYKAKISNAELNEVILNTINIIESNGDNIDINIPVYNNVFDFNSDFDRNKFFKTYNFDIQMSVKEALNKLYTKYEMEKYSDQEKYKMVQVRYMIAKDEYSLFKSINIARNISYNTVLMIEERKKELEGINIRVYPKRYYPNGTLAAHLLGYVSSINSDDYLKLKDKGYAYNSIIGKMGVEDTMEPYLKGVNGIKRVEVDLMGKVSNEYTQREPISGQNVKLTIDWNLQKVAEDSIASVIKDIQMGNSGFQKSEEADSGAVVAIDVTNGEILALASYPSFDPNEFIGGIKTIDWKKLSTDTARPLFNRTISGTYSPGSTYKMLVGTAGLETGVITPKEEIKDLGIYPYGHNPKCWIWTSKHTTHGMVNMSKGIKVSCNFYFYEVGRRTGIENIVKYAKLFGLGSKTGIELASENKGQIAGDDSKNKWYLGDTLSASIGQSYNSFTPVQLANYIATLSNGGNLNKVSIINSVYNNKGVKEKSSVVNEYTKKYTGVDFKTNKTEIKKENIDSIIDGMRDVTSEVGGTSYITFKNSEIKVAGKTGTSQVTTGKETGIFVGFAPIENPKIAVVAIIEHAGSGVYTASVVRPIMDEYFNISKKEAMIEFPKILSDIKVQY